MRVTKPMFRHSGHVPTTRRVAMFLVACTRDPSHRFRGSKYKRKCPVCGARATCVKER